MVLGIQSLIKIFIKLFSLINYCVFFDSLQNLHSYANYTRFECFVKNLDIIQLIKAVKGCFSQGEI